MTVRYSIHPAVGIARVGNSPEEFYLEPDRIGGLPIACDPHGVPLIEDGRPQHVQQFKDARGRAKRQASRFRVYRSDDDHPDMAPVEVDLSGPEVRSFRWTVHLANKKAAWYSFTELEGNLLYGPENSYEQRGVPKRNA